MSSLTPCRFYAQGSCRYGNNCRYYHEPRGQGAGMFGNKTLAPATFQPTGPTNQGALNLSMKANQNLDIIVEAVKKDMQEWQISKIWPYSCYGPVGGKPCAPGFEDLSTEEFRLAFMQCGNYLPPEMTQRIQQIQQLRLNYQQPTLENRAIIERIATITHTPTSPFGGQPTPQQTSNIFGGSAAPGQVTQSSIFGGKQFQTQQPASTGLFGQSTFGTTPATTFGTNVFQAQPTTQASALGSVFGAQTQTQPQTGFGGLSQQSQTGGLFQQAQNQGSIFQTPQISQPQTSNIFQQQPGQVQGNIFQQPALTSAGQSQLAGLLQQTQPLASTNIFQQQLQAQQQPHMTFSANQQQQGSIFAPTSTNIFGGGTQTTPQTATIGGGIGGGSIFGGSVAPSNVLQQGSTGASAGMAAAQKFVYSEEASLSPEEIEAFRAAEFTFDNLPLKPPPKSMCT